MIPGPKTKPSGVYAYRDVWVMGREVYNTVIFDTFTYRFTNNDHSVKISFEYDTAQGTSAVYATPIFWRYVIKDECKEIAQDKGIPFILWVPAQKLDFHHWETITHKISTDEHI